MQTINVDGLPDTIVDSLQAMVGALKDQFSAGERLPQGEGLKRAAGSWADAETMEFDHWLEETYQARRIERPEPTV